MPRNRENTSTPAYGEDSEKEDKWFGHYESEEERDITETDSSEHTTAFTTRENISGNEMLKINYANKKRPYKEYK